MVVRNEETFMYPERLTRLAMDTLGKYVSSLFDMLVAKKDEHLVKEVCGYLQYMLHDHVPNHLSEELKIRILRKFEDAYLQMRDICTFKDEYHEIAVDLFVAIVHESATSVECAKQHGHLDLLDAYRMRYLDIIYSALPRLKNLRVLRLYTSIFYNKECELLSFPPNLEECSLIVTYNDEIAKLSKCCRKLKVLDVYGGDSENNMCLPYIHEFEYLEELHCFQLTSADLFFQLKDRKRVCGKNASEFIKKLSCTLPICEYQVIQSIARNSPNLISLSLNEVDEDLYPLKVLNHLKLLSVKAMSYFELRRLLSSIGSQLTCLSLCFIKNIDIEHVEKCCTSVTCLHLKEYHDAFSSSPGMKLSNIAMPEFPQVTRLELDYSPRDESSVNINHALRGFINVKKIQLNVWNNDILNGLVKRHVAKSLEEVIISRLYGSTITLEFSEKYVVITDSGYLKGETVCVRSMPLPERL